MMYGGDLTFYDIIKLVPHVQELYFGDLEIEFRHLDTTELMLNDLKTLSVFGAKISNRVIKQLEQIAPNLEELRLYSSAVVDDNDKDGDDGNHTHGDAAISMPGVALKNVSIVTEECGFKKMSISNILNGSHIATIESMLGRKSNLYIHIKTQEAAEQFYLLPDCKRSITVISKQEFDRHSTDSLVIHIECEALSQLRVDLQRHKVRLQWYNGVLVM